MPARPRTSRSADGEARKRNVAPTAATPTETPQEDPVPEIRLLGSLHPAVNREERIAISAYWRAAQRQFAPGHELDDWLAAEREVDHEDAQHSAR